MYTVPVMSMIQLVIGTALGFVIAQSGLYGIRYSLGWLQREEIRTRIRTLPGHLIVGGFIRYAAPIGAVAALITLGVWALGDYMAAKAAHSAAALTNTLDPTTSAAGTPPSNPADEAGTSAAHTTAEPTTAVQPGGIDPYADPDYKVHRRAHRAGTPVTLKETLLQRSEAKARAELLHDMQEHASRSQYDCEAADHAARYLKAGLDVWGFAAWQLKYFPTDGYQGAMLPNCRDIPNVIDPSQLDLQSTLAQDGHP